MPPPARPLRVPLAVGLTALRSQLCVAFLAWPGLVVFLATLPVGRRLYDAVDVPVLGPAVALVGPALVGLAALFMWGWALSSSEAVRRERPSDLLLLADGLRVEGGPRHGLFVPWSEVAGCAVAPAARQEKRGLLHTARWLVTLGRWDAAPLRRQVTELRLERRGQGPVVLASSDDAEEVASFGALAEIVRALAAEEAPAEAEPPEPPEPPGEGAPALLLCSECSAALAPVDDETAICPWCAGGTPVPEALRARLRAPEETTRGRRAETLVARVLARPRLRGAEVWLAVVRWTGRLIWPLGFAAFLTVALLQEGRSRNYPVAVVTSGYVAPYRHGAMLAAVVALGALAALAMTAAAFLATRCALRRLSLRFGAVATARAGAPPFCRACGAPLPDRPGRLVVSCLYCAAENVLADGLLGAARRSREPARSVEAALADRRRAHQRLAMTAASLAIGLFLLGRELSLAAAWAPSRAPFSECVICTRASFRNVEDGRQLITITMDGRRRAFLIPGRARFDVECQGDCTVELGAHRLTIGDSPDPFDERPGPFELRDGRLQ